VVIPLGASEVIELVYRCLEPVVHGLRLLSFIDDESSELSLNHLPIGDLGDPITFMFHLEHVSYLLYTF
jgi:hypothetical protein